jgi:hypothetical protein
MLNYRDHNGRFKEGGPGGPGRPARKIEAEYLRITAEACSPDDWSAIVARAVKDAKAGDHRSRDFLARYVLGVPKAPASSLTQLAVNDEAGFDPMDQAIMEKKLLSFGNRALRSV